MRSFFKAPKAHYLTALAMVMLATLIAWLIPALRVAPLLFVAPIMISAWLGGMGPGLFSTALSVVSLDYFTFEPRYSLLVISTNDVLDLLVFTLVAVLTSWLAKRRRLAEERMWLYAQKLQEADRHKDEFLATLAHELRNPLAPIQYAAEMIQLESASDQHSALQLESRIIRDQVAQLVRLIDDLRDISRIRSGKIQLKREPVDLGSIVTYAQATCEQLIHDQGHKLSVSLPSEPIWLSGDAARLRQVLVNLLNNAAKYTEPNGSIHLAVERARDVATICVRDNGMGIDAAMLPHVFELFRQVDSSLDHAQGGLGIGLSLVRRLVEMHGGTITAHSAGLGLGSEFVVRLPTLAESSMAAAGVGASKDAHGVG